MTARGWRWGENDVRQLEFHFGAAQARGAETVLVTGAVQSNLVRIAAAGARRLGMDIEIQLEERVADVDELVPCFRQRAARPGARRDAACVSGRRGRGGGRGDGAARPDACRRGPHALRDSFRARARAARRARLRGGPPGRSWSRPRRSAWRSTRWSAPRAARLPTPVPWSVCARSA